MWKDKLIPWLALLTVISMVGRITFRVIMDRWEKKDAKPKVETPSSEGKKLELEERRRRQKLDRQKNLGNYVVNMLQEMKGQLDNPALVITPIEETRNGYSITVVNSKGTVFRRDVLDVYVDFFRHEQTPVNLHYGTEHGGYWSEEKARTDEFRMALWSRLIQFSKADKVAV